MIYKRNNNTIKQQKHYSTLSFTDIEECMKKVFTNLEENKAEKTIFIDVRNKAVFADLMIISSGRSRRHVNAIAGRLLRYLKEIKYPVLRVEGLDNALWVLIDMGDIVVHIFCPEERKFYNLEEIWEK